MTTQGLFRPLRTRSGYRAIAAGWYAALFLLGASLAGWSPPVEVAPFVPVAVSFLVFMPYHARTRRRWVTTATWSSSTSIDYGSRK